MLESKKHTATTNEWAHYYKEGNYSIDIQKKHDWIFLVSFKKCWCMHLVFLDIDA